MKIFSMVRCIKENPEDSDLGVYFDILETAASKEYVRQKMMEYKKDLIASGYRCIAELEDSQELMNFESDIAISFNIFEKELVIEEDPMTGDFFENYMKELLKVNVTNRLQKECQDWEKYVPASKTNEMLDDAAEKYFEHVKCFTEYEYSCFTDEMFHYYEAMGGKIA